MQVFPNPSNIVGENVRSMRAAYYGKLLGPRVGIEFARLEDEVLDNRPLRQQALDWIAGMAIDDRLLGIHLIRTRFIMKKDRDTGVRLITQKNRLRSRLEYATSAGQAVLGTDIEQLKEAYTKACESVEDLKDSIRVREALFASDMQSIAERYGAPEWMLEWN
jgi:hypothetical protein